MATLYELYWAAGFLEGEGSFSGHTRTARVSAWQVQKEPLGRLQRMFGGTIRYIQRRNAPPTHSAVHTWEITGGKARGVIMTLYALMSPKRQGQMNRALFVWLTTMPAGCVKTHCPQGHAYTAENTYVFPNGARQCRTCANLSHKRTRAKTKALWQLEQAPVLEQQRDWTVTHCRKGHERTPENTYQPPHGPAQCRICRLATKHRYYLRVRVLTPRPRVAEITHCRQGHPYTPENTYIQPSNGARFCRVCQAARGKAFRARQKG